MTFPEYPGGLKRTGAALLQRLYNPAIKSGPAQRRPFRSGVDRST